MLPGRYRFRIFEDFAWESQGVTKAKRTQWFEGDDEKSVDGIYNPTNTKLV